MPTTHSASLSPPPLDEQPCAKKRKVSAASRKAPKQPTELNQGTATDEFQQVTLPGFVDSYRIEDMGFGGDVFYQPDVR